MAGPDHPTAPVRHWKAQAVVLVIVAVAARLMYMALLPPRAYSVDLHDWRIAAAAMLEGFDPYVKYRVLNWPPFWMELLGVLGTISDRLNWDFFTVVRIALIGAEAVLLASTFALMRFLNRDKPVVLLVLVAFCLNPLLILLTVQQGNFDAFAAIAIVWFLYCLIRFRRDGDPLNWLCAAAWLGVGIFIKTFPFVLAPLLFGESRRLSWKGRILGLGLCLLPAVLSLAPLYAVHPHEVSEGVLAYRSIPGNAGVSALLNLAGGQTLNARYAQAFIYLLLAALAGLTAFLWRWRLPQDRDLVFLGSALLMALFELGPGYSPQYWFWVAPLLIVLFLVAERGFRWLLAVSAIIVVLTNLLVFSFATNHGKVLWWWIPTPTTQRIVQWIDQESYCTLLCLPMSVVTLALIVGCAWQVAQGYCRVSPMRFEEEILGA